MRHEGAGRVGAGREGAGRDGAWYMSGLGTSLTAQPTHSGDENICQGDNNYLSQGPSLNSYGQVEAASLVSSSSIVSLLTKLDTDHDLSVPLDLIIAGPSRCPVRTAVTAAALSSTSSCLHYSAYRTASSSTPWAGQLQNAHIW